MRRLQENHILKDLKKKMVFVVGPRQVGKTWLANKIKNKFKKPLYLNFDNFQDRKIIKELSWFEDIDLLILDEIHKMDNWKNFIKGIYDTKPEHLSILITGSARLNVLKKAGDSLAGRFYLHRLLPFSLKELKRTKYKGNINRLLERGGFPEPFLEKKIEDADRWRLLYVDSLLREEIFSFEKINEINAINNLFKLLQYRVGSPISYSSLSEDLNISVNTVKKYINILEDLYIIFKVHVYNKNIARSLLKSFKIYFYDIGLVKQENGSKFENLIALSLLKHAYFKTDIYGKDTKLMYLRTKDGKEVDFCIVENDIPLYILEVKTSSTSIDRNLKYFSNKYKLNALQIVKNIRYSFIKNNIKIINAIEFLESLEI